MEEYQVIVVGAGPAGSACAKALKDEGKEVLLIEKDKLPRYKTCSGVLMGQCQILLEKYFGSLPPEDIYCQPKVIAASSIEEWNKEKGFFPYIWEISKDNQTFKEDYLNIWRDKFDYWLLRESGVEYRDNYTFRSYSMERNKVKLEVTVNDKETKSLYCSYLVGADGGNSRVRMALDPGWSTESLEVSVYQAYHRFSDMGSLKEDHWYVFFESQFCDCLSCIHHKDEFLTLCVGGFKGRSLKESMEAFKKFLAENFRVMLKDKERDEGCVMRLSMPNLGNGQVVLTGEAAGIIYLNGEGISAALDSGFRAGNAISRAIKEDRDVIEIYEQASRDIVDHVKKCSENAHFFTDEAMEKLAALAPGQ